MRAVVQRVTRAAVRVIEPDGAERAAGAVGAGLCVLVGVGADDTDADAAYIRDKLVALRIFDDDEGRMNRSVVDVGGAILLVSQFTLYGDARKGRRPGFSDAMAPEPARAFFERFAASFVETGVPTATGAFRAHMRVDIQNDGPVTILLDSRRAF